MLERNPILQNPIYAKGNNGIGDLLALVVDVSLGRLANDQIVRQVVRVLERNSQNFSWFCGKTDPVVLHLGDQCRNLDVSIRLDDGIHRVGKVRGQACQKEKRGGEFEHVGGMQDRIPYNDN